jgi:pimeloyl-ACP methyl ester carboxylesterase
LATYALIPGGGGDPWEWHRLVPELASRGHDAIAVRLPAEDDRAGWSEYADAVVDAIGDRANVILVAASMGAFTAPIVCTRRRVDLLVLLNAMIPMPGETFNAWGTNTGSGPARREYHTSIALSPAEAEDDAVIYYHDLPSELRAEAQARTWQDQSMTPWTSPGHSAPGPMSRPECWLAATIGCSRSTFSAESPASASPSKSRRSTADTWSL